MKYTELPSLISFYQRLNISPDSTDAIISLKNISQVLYELKQDIKDYSEYSSSRTLNNMVYAVRHLNKKIESAEQNVPRLLKEVKELKKVIKQIEKILKESKK